MVFIHLIHKLPFYLEQLLNDLLKQLQQFIILFFMGISVLQAQEEQAIEPNLEKQWGIKPISIQLSAVGYMLDFRYQVTDPSKAKYVTDHQHKAYLIDQSSGAKFIVPSPPKIGSLRQITLDPKMDQIYFILFANPNRFIKPGTQVTVVIGDVKVANLVVK